MQNRLLVALLAGLLLAFSFPPYGLYLLIPPAFALQYIALRGGTPTQSAVAAATFSLVFYVLHVYWLVSLHPAFLILALILSVFYYGLWGLGLGGIGVNPWTVAAGWLLLQFVIEHVYLGFPWSRITTAFAEVPVLLQPVAAIGEVSWEVLIVLLIALITETALAPTRRTLIASGLTLVAVLLLLGWGHHRLARIDPGILNQSVTLVQPNVSIDWHQSPSESDRDRLSRHLVSLTRRSRAGDLVIWPESSVPGQPATFEDKSLRIRRKGGWRKYFRTVLGENRQLLFGTLLTSPHPHRANTLNLAILINSRAQTLDYYSKQIPVPLAENLPYMNRSSLLKHFGQWLGTSGIRPGLRNGLIVQSSGGNPIKFGVQICFEDIFGHYVRRQVHRGADALINISNDSWSKSTAQHRQHFYRSVVRAVETGRPMIRVGTTGISAVINPLGVIQERLGSYERGVVRERLPAPLDSTIYTRWVTLIAPFFFLLLAGLGWLESMRQTLESVHAETRENAS